MTRIELNDGKYVVIHDNGQGLRALRHGEEWRNLAGDNLVLAMAQEIERLRGFLDKLIGEIYENYPYTELCELAERIDDAYDE